MIRCRAAMGRGRVPERAIERMSEAAFLRFSEGREERWELSDGIPRMMAGAGRSHDRIVVNVLGLLREQLRLSRCEPFSGDTFIRIPGGNYRMPDAGVDCGAPGSEERWAQEPRLVVEVLSPSTRDFDLFGKVEEYRSVPSLAHILLLEPDQPLATLWSCSDGAWVMAELAGLERAVDMPVLGLSLPMGDIYSRVVFPARPRLIT